MVEIHPPAVSKLPASPRKRSRLAGRLAIVSRALWERARSERKLSIAPQRVLIAHHLLLGDTLMLTPLLAKLRALYPAAEVVMAVPEAFAPLYAGRPYGVSAQPWDPRDPLNAPVFGKPGFDLALVPGDNRYSWLALALGARWILAFAGDRPAYKSWPVDQLVPYPQAPAAWGDMVAGLLPGPAPGAYQPQDWSPPPAAAFALPTGPYAVLHLGASSEHKRWPRDSWRVLAGSLAANGVTPVWSAGRGEESLVQETDPQGRWPSFAGILDLPQLWHLLLSAKLLVSPDTGVAHLGRIVGTPTVALFGPGSPVLCGAGDFWRDSPYRAVCLEPFPCRDQRLLFKREISWVRRCARGARDCPVPRCMTGIGLTDVYRAIADLGVALKDTTGS